MPVAAAAPRRVPAWLLPAAVATGFALLFLGLFRDRLLPAAPVEVARVVAMPGGKAVATAAADHPSSGPMLFQASGWIEPDPLPVKATCLIDGVVERVHVLEGQSVKTGDLLASLIADDTGLALQAAEQNLMVLEAGRAAHVASVGVARKRLAAARAREDAAAAAKDEAHDRMKRLGGLPARAVSESDVVSARLGYRREESQHLAASLAAGEMEAEIGRLEAETKMKDAEIAAAQTEVAQAKLAAARTQVKAPIDGRVLRLLAAPGQKKMLQDNDPESSTVAVLYDPAKLQVRVDVPLADAAGLQIGQAARIRCSLLPEMVFHGTVTRITGEADLQRNTLQAKVSINDPSDQLRPEMLCRVEFLGLTTRPRGGSVTAASGVSTWVPAAAARGDSLWVCDPQSKRLSRRNVVVTADSKDGYTRIDDGVKPGEWIVVSPGDFSEGQRVQPKMLEP